MQSRISGRLSRRPLIRNENLHVGTAWEVSSRVQLLRAKGSQTLMSAIWKGRCVLYELAGFGLGPTLVGGHVTSYDVLKRTRYLHMYMIVYKIQIT